MKRVALMSLAAVAALYGGGYKIPENSLNAVALCSANVANAHGADMAFYNPANMVWADDVNTMAADLTYIHLSSITYAPESGEATESEPENVFIPSLFYVSPKLGDMRVGLSVVTPAGLAKRWKEQPGRTYSHEFSLETVDVGASLAYAIGDTLSVAAGARLLYSSGVVKSAFTLASRDMEGDSIDFGYNLALSYRPAPAWKLAATYRSKIDLTEEGDAVLYSPDLNENYTGTVVYDGEAGVTVPVPAALNLAVAWSLTGATTLEFVYERTFWSSYETLDFDYATSIGSPVASMAFDDPIAKNWKDVSAYRLGLTHRYDAQWTAMAGVVHDESPVPEESLGFETPDSDSFSFSFGGRYQYDRNLNFGLAGLYSIRSDRKVTNENIDGTFENSRVFLMTAGLEYRF
jgi:long-chain fatty acid transport protein